MEKCLLCLGYTAQGNLAVRPWEPEDDSRMTKVDDGFWNTYVPPSGPASLVNQKRENIWKDVMFAVSEKRLDTVDLSLIIALSGDSGLSIRVLAGMVGMSVGGIQKKMRKIRRVLGLIRRS